LPHLTLKIDTNTFCYRYSTLHVHTIPHGGAGNNTSFGRWRLTNPDGDSERQLKAKAKAGRPKSKKIL
jgi:hypothetical protein